MFAEKPMAGDLAAAAAMALTAPNKADPTTMVDFNFTLIMAWQQGQGNARAPAAIGALRHVTVHWHVESRAIQMRMRQLEIPMANDGGGALGNFVSHLFPLSRMVHRPDRWHAAAAVGPAGRRRPCRPMPCIAWRFTRAGPPASR